MCPQNVNSLTPYWCLSTYQSKSESCKREESKYILGRKFQQFPDHDCVFTYILYILIRHTWLYFPYLLQSFLKPFTPNCLWSINLVLYLHKARSPPLSVSIPFIHLFSSVFRLFHSALIFVTTLTASTSFLFQSDKNHFNLFSLIFFVLMWKLNFFREYFSGYQQSEDREQTSK